MASSNFSTSLSSRPDSFRSSISTIPGSPFTSEYGPSTFITTVPPSILSTESADTVSTELTSTSDESLSSSTIATSSSTENRETSLSTPTSSSITSYAPSTTFSGFSTTPFDSSFTSGFTRFSSLESSDTISFRPSTTASSSSFFESTTDSHSSITSEPSSTPSSTSLEPTSTIPTFSSTEQSSTPSESQSESSNTISTTSPTSSPSSSTSSDPELSSTSSESESSNTVSPTPSSSESSSTPSPSVSSSEPPSSTPSLTQSESSDTATQSEPSSTASLTPSSSASNPELSSSSSSVIVPITTGSSTKSSESKSQSQSSLSVQSSNSQSQSILSDKEISTSSVASVSASTTSESKSSSTSSPSKTPSSPSSTSSVPTTLKTTHSSKSSSHSSHDSLSTLTSFPSSSSDSSTSYAPVVFTTTSTSILLITKDGKTATSTSISVFAYTVTPTFDISTVSSDVLATNSLFVSAASAAAAANSNGNNVSQGPSAGTIVGSVVGSVAGVAVIGIALLLLFSRRHKRKRDSFISSDSSIASPTAYLGGGGVLRDNRPGADSDDEEDGFADIGRRNPGRPPGQKPWWESLIPFAVANSPNHRRRSIEPLQTTTGPLPEVVGENAVPGTTPNGHANSATGQIPVSGTSPDNTAPGTGNSGSTSRWSTPSSTHRSSAISADNISPIHGITALAVTGAASPDSNADENNKPVTTSSSIVTNNHDPEPGVSSGDPSNSNSEPTVPGAAVLGGASAPRSYYRAPRRLNGNSNGSSNGSTSNNTKPPQNSLPVYPVLDTSADISSGTGTIPPSPITPVDAYDSIESRSAPLVVINPSDPEPRDSIETSRLDPNTTARSSLLDSTQDQQEFSNRQGYDNDGHGNDNGVPNTVTSAPVNSTPGNLQRNLAAEESNRGTPDGSGNYSVLEPTKSASDQLGNQTSSSPKPYHLPLNSIARQYGSKGGPTPNTQLPLSYYHTVSEESLGNNGNSSRANLNSFNNDPSSAEQSDNETFLDASTGLLNKSKPQRSMFKEASLDDPEDKHIKLIPSEGFDNSMQDLDSLDFSTPDQRHIATALSPSTDHYRDNDNTEIIGNNSLGRTTSDEDHTIISPGIAITTNYPQPIIQTERHSRNLPNQQVQSPTVNQNPKMTSSSPVVVLGDGFKYNPNLNSADKPSPNPSLNDNYLQNAGQNYYSKELGDLKAPPSIPGARDIHRRRPSGNGSHNRNGSEASKISSSSKTSSMYTTPEQQQNETFRTPPPLTPSSSALGNDSYGQDESGSRYMNSLNGGRDNYMPVTPISTTPDYNSYRDGNRDSFSGSWSGSLDTNRNSNGREILTDSPSGGIGGILGVGRDNNNEDSSDALPVSSGLRSEINYKERANKDYNGYSTVIGNGQGKGENEGSTTFGQNLPELSRKSEGRIHSVGDIGFNGEEDDNEESIPVLRSSLSRSPKVVEQSPGGSARSSGGPYYGTLSTASQEYSNIPNSTSSSSFLNRQIPMTTSSSIYSLDGAANTSTNSSNVGKNEHSYSLRDVWSGTNASTTSSSNYVNATEQMGSPALNSPSEAIAPTLGSSMYVAGSTPLAGQGSSRSSSISDLGNKLHGPYSFGNLNVGSVAVSNLRNGSNNGVGHNVSRSSSVHKTPQHVYYNPGPGGLSPTPWQATIHHVDMDDDGASNKSTSTRNSGYEG